MLEYMFPPLVLFAVSYLAYVVTPEEGITLSDSQRRGLVSFLLCGGLVIITHPLYADGIGILHGLELRLISLGVAYFGAGVLAGASIYTQEWWPGPKFQIGLLVLVFGLLWLLYIPFAPTGFNWSHSDRVLFAGEEALWLLPLGWFIITGSCAVSSESWERTVSLLALPIFFFLFLLWKFPLRSVPLNFSTAIIFSFIAIGLGLAGVPLYIIGNERTQSSRPAS